MVDPISASVTLPTPSVSNASPAEGLPIIKGDEFLPPIHRWIVLGGLILVSGVTAATIASALIQYNIAVKADVTLRPDGDLRLVQAPLEGTVKQIAVQENQAVKQGDAIAYLDDTKLQIQKSQLTGNLQQNRLQMGLLDAQVRSIDHQILAETQSNQRAVAAATVEIQRHRQEYSERQRTTQADFEEMNAMVEAAQDEYDRYQSIANEGAISELQLKQKESALQTAIAKRTRTQALLEPSNAAITVAQEQVAQQQARGQATLASLQKEQDAVTQRRSEVQNQLLRDQKELEQVERDLSRSVIRATSDGLIFQLKLQNPQQVVRPGDTIAQITPQQVPLVAKAKVANQDIDKVAVGQSVQMRVNACSYTEFGILKGKVTAIATDAIASRTSEGSTGTSSTGTGSNSDRTYEVLIKPDTTLLVNGHRQCRLQIGMDASASIISKQETFLQFLLRKARLTTNL